MYAKPPGINQSSPKGRRPRDGAGKRKWGAENRAMFKWGERSQAGLEIQRPPLAAMSPWLPPDGSTRWPSYLVFNQYLDLARHGVQGPQTHCHTFSVLLPCLSVVKSGETPILFCFVLVFSNEPSGRSDLAG